MQQRKCTAAPLLRALNAATNDLVQNAIKWIAAKGMRKSRSTQQVALTIPARDYTSNKDDDATRRSKPWSTRLQIFLLCKIRAKSGAAARAAALCALALLSLAVLFIGRALVTQVRSEAVLLSSKKACFCYHLWPAWV